MLTVHAIFCLIQKGASELQNYGIDPNRPYFFGTRLISQFRLVRTPDTPTCSDIPNRSFASSEPLSFENETFAGKLQITDSSCALKCCLLFGLQ